MSSATAISYGGKPQTKKREQVSPPEKHRNTESHMMKYSESQAATARSYNWGLLEAAKEMLPDNTTLEIFDVSRFPLFTQDHERGPPAEVRLFKQKI